MTIVFLILFIASFLGYNRVLETKTFPYESKNIIIGNTRIKNGGDLKKNGIMKHFGGDSNFVRSLESIQVNKSLLLISFTMSNFSMILLIICLINSFILYKAKYKSKD